MAKDSKPSVYISADPNSRSIEANRDKVNIEMARIPDSPEMNSNLDKRFVNVNLTVHKKDYESRNSIKLQLVQDPINSLHKTQSEGWY